MRPMFQGSIVALVTRSAAARWTRPSSESSSRCTWRRARTASCRAAPRASRPRSATTSTGAWWRSSSRRRADGWHVIAGTGSNATSEAIDLTTHAKKAGATGRARGQPVLQQADPGGTLPPLPRGGGRGGHPDPRSTTSPGRTAVNVETDTLVRLVKDCPQHRRRQGGLRLARPDDPGHPRVRPGLQRPLGRRQHHPARSCRSAAAASISVIANFVPRETAEMTHAALAGDWKLARELHLKLFPLVARGVHGDQPHPREGSHGHDGDARSRSSACPCAAWARRNRERLRAILVQHGLIKG